MRLRTAVTSAIKYRKKQSEKDYNLAVEELRKDIVNSPYQPLGDHSRCSERKYFCDGLPKHGEINPVFKGNSSTRWGTENEQIAIAQFESENPGMFVRQCGLAVDEEFPFLGESPDGLTGDDEIIEVKCPSYAKTILPMDGIGKGKINFMEIKDDKHAITTYTKYRVSCIIHVGIHVILLYELHKV
ncbi:hypothetical protein PR048_002076 [Dryococelus australis]|uniref:YqaJ viral recombinase domain-containing protein n=1 Tax=Dryococelus australis TaxID=614101 RepID=A0ABQ9IJ81_9NEOP|nr:hypothetical protein PR048_002076 [Dryococelus australis]